MQGKGIVKFFLVVMIVVTLIQYMFILPTNKVERNAALYAQQIVDSSEETDPVKIHDIEAKATRDFIDSLSNETVFKIPMLKSYTYQELKSQQLAYGLDLKGGMSVVLQIDLRKLIYALAQSSKDPTLKDALEKASEAQKNAQADYVTLFANEWTKIRGEKRLAPIFQRNESLRDEINYETSDGEVIRILRAKADETVGLTFNLLKQRIDKLGVIQPNVSLDKERDLIIVELPGIDNPERARKFLQAAANLEFFATYRVSDQPIVPALTQANDKLRTLLNTEDAAPVMQIDTLYVTDSLGQVSTEIERIDTTYANNTDAGPLFDIMTVAGGSVIGIVEAGNLDTLKGLLAREDVLSLFPTDLRFRYSRDPFKPTLDDGSEDLDAGDMYQVYAIKMPRNGVARLSGDRIEEASAQPDPQGGQIAVSLTMDQAGAKIWGQMTSEAAKDVDKREIAILLDDEVVSAPRVNEPILGGRSQITGGFSLQEATDLSSILQIGKLPVQTKIIQESVVGPSLGAENIQRSMTAIIIGILSVIAFMIFYYGGGGIVSVLALVLNLLFIFGALASYGTVLTVPGVAGIILTIGMAVDANVIIFERIREELREGKTTAMAIADGFKHSYSAIIDANVTTILTAFVLAYFGLGPIKGFAVVLIIGVLSSLFTAVLVGRLMVDSWMKRKKTMTFSSALSKGAFSKVNIDWVGKRKIAYFISGTIIVLGIVSMLSRGFDLGVDFKGGYSYTVNIASGSQVDVDELRTNLTTAFDNNTPVVKEVDGSSTFNIVTDYPIDLEDIVDKDGKTVTPDQQGMAALYEGFKSTIDANVDYDNFSNADGVGTHVSSYSQVGPTIADDITRSAIYAAVFALLLIFLYIFLRFNKWQYSLGAVTALFHDTLIVLGIFSMGWGLLGFNMEIDQPFIAAILTVIGYSINDTVVVFDRIREYLNKYTSGDKKTVINAAINSTVSRTVITSLTTLFVVFVLFAFGGTSIKGFAFAILVGILVGTYSSIFVASPLVYDLTDDNLVAKKEDVKKSFSRAAQNS